MWCGGERDRRAKCHTKGLLPKENIFSALPAFQDLNDC